MTALTQRFQFTHPGKGATRTQPHIDIEVRVSIHAPWEGCDWEIPHTAGVRNQFQFTHPGKGATVGQPYFHLRINVSIHAPWEGCDPDIDDLRRLSFDVSIHAPWEGCDTKFGITKVWGACFNSRTLGRVRLGASSPRTARSGFNSRTLGRVRLG